MKAKDIVVGERYLLRGVGADPVRGNVVIGIRQGYVTYLFVEADGRVRVANGNAVTVSTVFRNVMRKGDGVDEVSPWFLGALRPL